MSTIDKTIDKEDSQSIIYSPDNNSDADIHHHLIIGTTDPMGHSTLITPSGKKTFKIVSKVLSKPQDETF